MTTSRRNFLGLMAAGACAGPLGYTAFAGESQSYTVALLGDTHFDSPDKKLYHSKYTHSTNQRRYEAHLQEHVRNAEMWTARMPSLLRASAASVRPDTAFVLHMGDLVQGDCGDPAMHRMMLRDGFGAIKGAYGGKLPLVPVVGNHDIRGDVPEDFALETVDGWYPHQMSLELGQDVRSTSFSFRHGQDAFVVVDFNEPRPDFQLLTRLLDDAAGARHMFLISHGPAIPNCASRWFLLGSKARDGERRELLHMLAKRNAIVLSGHTHNLEYYDCALSEGRVTQFVASSVWNKPELNEIKVIDDGVADYGKHMNASKHVARPAAKKQMAALAAEYRPLMRQYFLAHAAGHFQLKVSPDRVAVDFFGGASTSPSRTFVLRDGGKIS